MKLLFFLNLPKKNFDNFKKKNHYKIIVFFFFKSYLKKCLYFLEKLFFKKIV